MVPEFIARALAACGMASWVTELNQRETEFFSERQHGDYRRWRQCLESLPEIQGISVLLEQPAVSVTGECSEQQALTEALQGLMPWRKGPFQISGIHIDSEWRSDWKWARIEPHLQSLTGRRILDVGCGNGYHCWRMLAQDPELVLGIDPSMLFNLQFRALQHYARDQRIHLLPLADQDLPNDMQCFDSVFSMGVLYHRRSPFDHLLKLRSLLRPGGELCLETLIIEGGAGRVLIPDARYARMNNVWFLPSSEELCHWLQRCGFNNIRVVDINRTSLQEQRSTEWMKFESLAESLDPNDRCKTIEGYSAPTRAVVLATR